mmetsp:Transcript_6963/g.17735  ORF Transcript_6963/g.17735 Transcript_6963/m.17735 type:complete len:88 (+) Transcript_6963:112-375(+)
MFIRRKQEESISKCALIDIFAPPLPLDPLLASLLPALQLDASLRPACHFRTDSYFIPPSCFFNIFIKILLRIFHQFNISLLFQFELG